VDAEGNLVEGHLTIASFEWWTEQFDRQGSPAASSRTPVVRRHPAGRPGPVLEHLRSQSRWCARFPSEPRCPRSHPCPLGLDHPLLNG